eukprot:326711-Pelagomonas_calceolata.AAC.2
MLEPRLATFLHSVVLSHKSVEAAFSFLMAAKLADNMMLGPVQDGTFLCAGTNLNVGGVGSQAAWETLLNRVQDEECGASWALKVEYKHDGGENGDLACAVLDVDSLDVCPQERELADDIALHHLPADRVGAPDGIGTCIREEASSLCCHTRLQILTIFREAYDDDPSILEAGLSDLQVGNPFLQRMEMMREPGKQCSTELF